MIAILRKEIASFFSSLIGYLVISVFLMVTGLFLWVFPGELNILFGGYASLESLFLIAPWIYLFLVPAITMRLFADEKRSGTIELLLTRPLSELQVVLGKYLAGLALVFFSLLPTLLYYYSVYQLGSPVGSIDTGGTWGSFIGLFLLAAVYVSIGVFSSSLTENQIFSFVLAVIICFLFYMGFDSIAGVAGLGKWQFFIEYLGIESHYSSISRGVVDTRDVFYFISVIVLFLAATRLILLKRKW